jgi:hypothetical protein
MELEDREYNSKVDKNLKICRVKNSGLFAIKFVGGGELPAELKAMWTTPQLAEAAIEKYMKPKPKRTIKKEAASG